MSDILRLAGIYPEMNTAGEMEIDEWNFNRLYTNILGPRSLNRTLRHDIDGKILIDGKLLVKSLLNNSR